jgi:hypothetical protein
VIQRWAVFTATAAGLMPVKMLQHGLNVPFGNTVAAIPNPVGTGAPYLAPTPLTSRCLTIIVTYKKALIV